MPNIAIDIIKDLYNFAIAYGYIPKEWKIMCLVPIPKQHADQNHITNLRPIALISCIRKTLEIIIADKLQHHLQHNNLWPEHQNGFKKGGSTLHNLVLLVLDVQIALAKHENLEALFLGIKRPYDNVNITMPLNSLQEYKLPRKLMNFMQALLTERIVTIHTTQNKDYRTANVGLVQGSPLSPILFNLYTAKIAAIQEQGIRLLQYADDRVIYRTIPKQAVEDPKFQITVKRTTTRLRSYNLEVNPQKCHYIIFKDNRQKFLNLTTGISGTRIQNQKNLKFLGIYLDEHLQWERQMNHLLNKITVAQRIIVYLTGRWWGASAATLINIYKSLIQPIIDYGSITITYSQKDKRRLQSAIYKILKHITGVNGNPAYNALAVETQLMPPDIRAQKLAVIFLTKIYTNINNRITPKVQYIQENTKTQLKYNKLTPLQQVFSMFKQHKDNIIRMPKNPVFTLTWEQITQHRNVYIKEINLDNMGGHDKSNSRYRNSKLAELQLKCIYTDGSKQQEGVGAAVYSLELKINQCYKLPAECTIYTAEAFAIRQALIHIQKNKLHNVVILSDSQSVLKKIQTTNLDPYESWYITNIKQLMNNLGNRNIYLAWIPGHQQIQGNEKADSLAKEAVTGGINNPILLPSADYKKILHKEVHKEWDKQWQKYIQNHAKYYGSIQPQIPRKHWITTSIPRRLTTLFTRFRMGTIQTPQYLHRIQKRENPLCICGQFGSLDHVVLECTRHTEQTNIFYREMVEVGIPLPTKVESILTDTSITIIKALHRHISRCKMKI